MRIGKMLKIYMDMNDIHVREVGHEIGISHSTVSRIMNGQTTDISTAVKLLAWLFEDEGVSKKK